MTTDTKTNEEFRVNGGQVWVKVKELARAGNARHLVINNKKDKKFLSMTVTIAAILTFLAPQIVAVLVIVALLFGFSVVIEKDEKNN